MYSCSSASSVTITLSRGSGQSFSPRALVAGAARLSYNLYLDAARTIVWGDAVSGTSAYGPTSPPVGSGVTVPVYGRVPARQNVPAGAYADSLVVTVAF